MSNIVRFFLVAICAALLAACAGDPASTATSTSKLKAIPATEMAAFIQNHLGEYLHYPPLEAERRIEGISQVLLSVNQEGLVTGTRILRSSGDSELDGAALQVWQDLMNDGVRFPLSPGSSQDAGETVLVEPINFCIAQVTCENMIKSYMDRMNAANEFARLARAEFVKGIFDQSILYDTQAINLLPMPDFLLHRGWTYYVEGALDSAEADLTASINAYPSPAAATMAYNDRGLVYMEKGAYDRAVDDFSKAIELNPRFIRPYANRAEVYLAQRKGDETLADYAKIIELEPDSPHGYNGRAWAYHLLGRSAEGLPDANKAIALNPRHANFLDTRAHIYEDLGQRDSAMADYKAALALNPSLTASLDGLKRLNQ